MSAFTFAPGQQFAGGLVPFAAPKILFVPDQLYRTLKLTNEPFSILTDLEQALQLIGPTGIATLLYVNSLYNSHTDKFLKDEIVSGFSTHDLMDGYRDQLKGREDLREPYANIVKQYDGLLLTKPELPESYLRTPAEEVVFLDNDMENTAHDPVQYYVPEMFVVCERVYGVRLKAFTGLEKSDFKKALKQVTVANMGLLSKSYDIRQIAQFDIFKSYVANC